MARRRFLEKRLSKRVNSKTLSYLVEFGGKDELQLRDYVSNSDVFPIDMFVHFSVLLFNAESLMRGFYTFRSALWFFSFFVWALLVLLIFGFVSVLTFILFVLSLFLFVFFALKYYDYLSDFRVDSRKLLLDYANTAGFVRALKRKGIKIDSEELPHQLILDTKEAMIDLMTHLQ